MNKSIKVKLNNRCNSKLKFVKGLRELTGLYLKDAKDIVDNICKEPFKIVELNCIDTISLSNLLNEQSWEEVSHVNYEINGGTQWQREIKMLQLGVGDKNDYVDFIKQFIQGSFGNSDELLTNIIQKLTKDELVQVIKKIEY